MTTSRLLILGASGDLTGRYLLRALAELVDHGRLPGGVEIIGVAREPWDTEQFRNHAEHRLDDHASDLSRSSRDSLLRRLSYIRGDVTQADNLRAAVGEGEAPVVAYLALPPTLFASAISGLASAGMPDGSRVAVEKPFGTDLASAQQLNALLHRHFLESAIFRMDHFLGKQTVQNILGLRFANRLFEPLWCGEHIEAIDIVWDETVALEGRAGYYDGTGALRDMVQNHLLQLLCLLAMELSMDPDKVPADLVLNGAGDPFCLEPAHWELELAPQEMSAYARLLLDVLEGDPSLSIRGDEAEECWRIVEPILSAWNAGMSPIRSYEAGSRGPVPDNSPR